MVHSHTTQNCKSQNSNSNVRSHRDNMVGGPRYKVGGHRGSQGSKQTQVIYSKLPKDRIFFIRKITIDKYSILLPSQKRVKRQKIWLQKIIFFVLCLYIICRLMHVKLAEICTRIREAGNMLAPQHIRGQGFMQGSMISSILGAKDHYATCGVPCDECGLTRVISLAGKGKGEIKRFVDERLSTLSFDDSEE